MTPEAPPYPLPDAWRMTAAKPVRVWLAVLSVGGGAGWLLLLVVPLLLGALVVALAGVIGIVLRWRHLSFGRRPIGVSVGRFGIVRYYLDGADEWAWHDIAAVTAKASGVDPKTGDFIPLVVVHLKAGPEHRREQELNLSGYEAHAWLIYTALRFWTERPWLRDELSTTFAQQRIAAWREAMDAAAIGTTPQRAPLRGSSSDPA